MNEAEEEDQVYTGDISCASSMPTEQSAATQDFRCHSQECTQKMEDETERDSTSLPWHYKLGRCLVSCLPHSVSQHGIFRPETEGNGDFQWYSLLSVTVGMVMFHFDLGADLFLAKSFWKRGGDFERPFIATSVILLLSIVLGTSLSVYFCRRESKQEGDTESSWKCRYFIPAAILQLWHIVRSIELLYYGCKSRATGISDAERTEYTEKLKRREKHHSYLGYVESIVESLPQLLVQFYVVTVLHPEEGSINGWLILFKVTYSWVSISLAMASLQVSPKNTDGGPTCKPKTFTQKLMCLPWRALELGIFLCFIILYLCTHLPNGGALILGFLCLRTCVMYFFLARCVKMDRKRGRCWNIVLALLLNFSFISFHGGLTRGKVVVFYVLFYVTLAHICLNALNQDAPYLYNVLYIFLVIHLFYVLVLVLQYVWMDCLTPFVARIWERH